jgi:hypothetical protein
MDWRTSMKKLRFLKIALLAAALLGVALSCSLDYLLDFELHDIAIGTNTVQVDYTLTNHGTRTMDSATITVRVSCDVAGGYGFLTPEQATPGETLIPGGSASGRS